MMSNHLHAGTRPGPEALVDVAALRTAYYARTPDVADRAQRVVFGTGGHRGSAFEGGFNESHVVAITQAICEYRRQKGIAGPLFLGRDTHALSEPAFTTAMEVLAANRIHVMLQPGGGCTPAPAISRAIVVHNRSQPAGQSDGIIITSSHNPPADGGVKYNTPDGGPAGAGVTRWIETRANQLLAGDEHHIDRITYARARRANTVHVYDYIGSYVRDLALAVDVDVIARSGLRIGVDPLGGASMRTWGAVAERYGLNVEVVNGSIDPTFRFMPLDWDGQIRLDSSSSYAMATLIGLKDRFDIALGNDADADRFGVVTRAAGLMDANAYLAAAAAYLFAHRPAWPAGAALGRTVVSSSMLDRVAHRAGRRVVEVPVGFKWFVRGLLDGTIGFAGEESAGASFLQRDGLTWTTGRDGIVMNLLAAELMAKTGQDPAEFYRTLQDELGTTTYERVEAVATPALKEALAGLSADDVFVAELAGDPIVQVMTAIPETGAPIGGLKITTQHGWFAVRPSETEPVYRLYAESYLGIDHLRRIQFESQALLDRLLGTAQQV